MAARSFLRAFSIFADNGLFRTFHPNIACFVRILMFVGYSESFVWNEK